MIDSNTEWPFLLGGIATNCRARVHTHVHLHLVRVLQVGNGSGKVSEQGRGESRDRKGGKKNQCRIIVPPFCATPDCNVYRRHRLQHSFALYCLFPFATFNNANTPAPKADFISLIRRRGKRRERRRMAETSVGPIDRLNRDDAGYQYKSKWAREIKKSA